MLKSNSNELTFVNEIQNLRDQREKQFRKPTYAEVTNENKQDKFCLYCNNESHTTKEHVEMAGPEIPKYATTDEQ